MKKIKQILAVVISVMMIISTLPATVVHAKECNHTLTLDTPYEIAVSSNGELVSFTPEYDGWYKFYSTGNWDTYSYLYNSDMEFIKYVDDTYTNPNFNLKHKLYAGKTYYLEVGASVSYNQTANFTLHAEETVGVESAVVKRAPNITTVVKGYEGVSTFQDGLEVTFTLSNGSAVNWSYDRYTEVSETEVRVETKVDETGCYFLEISCGEAYTRYYYNTIEDPVDHIKYSGTPLEYYENCNGYYSYETNEYIYHYSLPAEATITIYYKDGTSITSPVSERHREGYARITDTQNETPWVKGRKNYITVQYLGAETQIPVSIIESPLAYIEILSEPTMKNYEDYYYPILNGMKIRITDKNGVSDTVTISDENTKYISDGTLTYIVQIGEREMTVSYEYDISLGQVYILYCEGKEIKYANFNFVPTSYITAIAVDKISPDVDGMTVTVNYADNTEDTIYFDIISSNNYGYGYHNGYAMTKNGIAYYDMNAVYEGNKIVGYNFTTLGTTIFVETPDYIIGDVDNDGAITVCDATAIQLWLVGKQELNYNQKYAANVDNNASITVDDVTNIQLYLANLIDAFE